MMKGKKKIVIIILIILVIVLIIAFRIANNSNKSKTSVNDFRNVKELSEQTSTQLNLSIKDQMNFVEIMVDSIERGYFDNCEEIFEIYKEDLEKYHFTRLVILDKEGNGTTLAKLQRDDNIYEICIAEVTVKSTMNLTENDIVDTRLDKDLCGIVNSLISVDGEELYQKFQEYIRPLPDTSFYAHR